MNVTMSRWLAPVVLWGAMIDEAGAAGNPPDAIDSFLQLHAETRGFTLGRPVLPIPTPDGKSVLFLRSGPRDTVNALYEYDVASGNTRELLTPASLLHGADEHLSPEEKARRERMRVSTRGFTSYQLSEDGALLLVSLSGRLYTVRRADAHVEELPTGNAPVIDPRLSPDGSHVGFVRDRDLYVIHLASRRETRLTHTADPHKSAGLAEFVAQEEMERHTGYWWSPDGKRIAWQETDNNAVEEMHLVDPAHPERAPDVFRYPRPGKSNAQVKLFVVELPAPGKAPPAARAVTWDAAALPYLSQVSWRKGGPLTFVVRSRDQTEVKVLVWDEPAGKGRVVVEERDGAWLNIDPTLPRWLPDGSGFLWSSDAGGHCQLQLRAPDGKLVRVLSPAEVEYRGVRHVDRGAAWFVGSAEASELHVFRVKLDGSAPAQRTTTSPGVHEVVVAEDGQTTVTTATTLLAMPRASVVQSGRAAGDLPSVAVDPPWIPKVEMAHAGPRALRAIVVRPRNFDAKKKYPVMVDVYGGPHHQVVLSALPSQLIRQWIADHGYLVIAVDGRGTPGRGRAFERALKEAQGHGSFSATTLDDSGGGAAGAGEDAPRDRSLSRGHLRLVIRWLHGGAGGAQAAGRVPRRGGRRAGDRLARLRHLLHRALPRPARRQQGRIRRVLAAHLRQEPEAPAAAHPRHHRR